VTACLLAFFFSFVAELQRRKEKRNKAKQKQDIASD
jgi:hypothetical protein